MKVGADQEGAFNPIRGHHPDLFGAIPAVIRAEDLLVLNTLVAFAVAGLREAAARRRTGEDRQAAVVALNVAWVFFAAFKPVLGEGLHAPLLDLLDGVRALDDGNVVPLLRPLRPKGRARDTGYRKALLATVVVVVRMLRSSGMQRTAAHKLVAAHLDRLGVRPSRGSGNITERTVRGWCASAAEDVGGHTIAGALSKGMDSDEWRSKNKTMPPAQQRQRALELLTQATALFIGMERRQKPVSPTS